MRDQRVPRPMGCMMDDVRWMMEDTLVKGEELRVKGQILVKGEGLRVTLT